MTFQNYGSANEMNTWEQPTSTVMCGVEPQNVGLKCGMERMFEEIEHPNSGLEAENRRLSVMLEEQNKSAFPRLCVDPTEILTTRTGGSKSWRGNLTAFNSGPHKSLAW